MNSIETSLATLITIVVYTYVLYPLLLGLVGRRCNGNLQAVPAIPSVSILVVAHNESMCIAQRLENIFSLAYDLNKLEVVVASDGSTDNTAEIASGFSQRGVKVIAFQTNRGKPTVLNRIVPTLKGEIVVLLDARQTLEPDALPIITEDFGDKTVGAVSGELVFAAPDKDQGQMAGTGLYWRYEKYIRLNESRIDSVIGATGAFYAFRKDLFEPVPDDTLIEDVLIPMTITRRGYRVIFKQGATVYDALPSAPETEFRRKVRTIAGNFQLFHRHHWLLNPVKNRLWIQTISHKALRLVIPACLVAIFALNAVLLSGPIYQAMFSLQLLFYSAAGAAHLWPSLRSKSPLVSLAYTFCLLNWSTVVGFYRYIRGQQRVTWRSQRA
ncbi:cellulose synthase/poly-beta-1,6-N-acetylglucosamine synthase-like glycosyltransferase [Litorivivens lipolytica]|uniref:Cellulose synthase/poly-beta-1,6-N-acetylglucosamine synthase-like glycosyltransferase n=1 Tax=Litorivivens lipolytica TaxID=1524264 RepID=A0A7W4Z637_9GAMM|nr:glycosyltransferase family 2 protein [Litorivivens lipolytica]MBB3047838.1 cellulose synthase/poly-beta-1,6-N-acetylglucosamine synthase-like glycosyltransferase [Litorivivens lipolytica]